MCLARVVQALSELDPRSTILSVDGVGAFDNVSRAAIFQGVADMPHGEKLIPFIGLFCSTPSRYLWENEVGENVDIFRGEGGEEGDPIMPMLFQFGATSGPCGCQCCFAGGRTAHGILGRRPRFFPTGRVPRMQRWGSIYTRLACLHHGKTKIWNAHDEKPERIDVLEMEARRVQPRPWCGEMIQSCSSPSRGRGSWGSPWATPVTSCLSWSGRQMSMRRF